jgi:hypothetical protein
MSTMAPAPEEVAATETLMNSLSATNQERTQAETRMAELVVTARLRGVEWKRIGVALGVSTQAAQQRFGPLVRAAEREAKKTRGQTELAM